MFAEKLKRSPNCKDQSVRRYERKLDLSRRFSSEKRDLLFALGKAERRLLTASLDTAASIGLDIDADIGYQRGHVTSLLIVVRLSRDRFPWFVLNRVARVRVEWRRGSIGDHGQQDFAVFRVRSHRQGLRQRLEGAWHSDRYSSYSLRNRRWRSPIEPAAFKPLGTSERRVSIMT